MGTLATQPEGPKRQEHDPGNPDAIYTYDPTLVGAEGAVLLMPGKEGRRCWICGCLLNVHLALARSLCY